MPPQLIRVFGCCGAFLCFVERADCSFCLWKWVGKTVICRKAVFICPKRTVIDPFFAGIDPKSTVIDPKHHIICQLYNNWKYYTILNLPTATIDITTKQQKSKQSSQHNVRRLLAYISIYTNTQSIICDMD